MLLAPANMAALLAGVLAGGFISSGHRQRSAIMMSAAVGLRLQDEKTG